MPLCLLTVDDVGRAGKMKPGRVGMVTQRLVGQLSSGIKTLIG